MHSTNEIIPTEAALHGHECGVTQPANESNIARQNKNEEEPQDLSFKQDEPMPSTSQDLSSNSTSQEIYGLGNVEESNRQTGSFTSPKKMMLLREAARENERISDVEDDRLATLAGVASQLVDSKTDSAPDVLVVPNTGDRSEDSAEVSANVTVETSRPR